MMTSSFGTLDSCLRGRPKTVEMTLIFTKYRKVFAPSVIPAKGVVQKLRPLPVVDKFSHFSTPPVIPAKAGIQCANESDK